MDNEQKVTTTHPRNTEDHDLLFIPLGKPLQRIQVDKREWSGGRPRDDGHTGAAINVLPPSPPDDSGFRKAMSIAAPDQGEKTGPAFACLPIRPEPATSAYTCYLVNGNNVNFKNPWTSSGWNDQPDPEESAAPEAWGPASFEVLIAGTRGRVYHLVVDNGQTVRFNEVDLSVEGEIWIQLRSGVVAGRVKYFKHPDGTRVLPIVNVTALNF